MMRGFLLLGALVGTSILAQPLQFKEYTVTSGLKMGYQLVAADLNGDGRLDLIALDERGAELTWYEAPNWQRHVLAAPIERPINLECHDTNGDRIPECILALHFESSPEKSIGDVYLLTAGPDVRQPWTLREIDRVPTAHRIRWIDLNGDGKKVALLSPLVGAAARAPLFDTDTPVYLYRPGVWKRETVITNLHGVAHSVAPVRWKGKRDSLLTASFQGLRLYTPTAKGLWPFVELTRGDPRPCPDCGSSEVRLGQLGKTRMIVSIEPWHGNQVVVNLQHGKQWTRTVIEDQMLNGHALAVGDLDGDGRDEIVSGFRGKGYRLTLYRAEDPSGTKWSKQILDTRIAAAECKIADFTGDSKPDIACIGASTGNVKLYVNQRP